MLTYRMQRHPIIATAILLVVMLVSAGVSLINPTTATAAIAPPAQQQATAAVHMAVVTSDAQRSTGAFAESTDCNKVYGFSYYCHISPKILSANPVFRQDGQLCMRITNKYGSRGQFSVNSDGVSNPAVRLNPNQHKSICGRLAKGKLAHAFIKGCFGGGETCYSGGVRTPRAGVKNRNHAPTSADGHFTRTVKNPYGHQATLQLNNGAGHNFKYIGARKIGSIGTVLNRGQRKLINVAYAYGRHTFVFDARYVKRP